MHREKLKVLESHNLRRLPHLTFTLAMATRI